jgi:hypothetical protein
MNERQKLFAMLQRVSAICDRVTARICQSIATRTDLGKLDELFTLGERGHKLYWRIYTRFDATLSEKVSQ